MKRLRRSTNGGCDGLRGRTKTVVVAVRTMDHVIATQMKPHGSQFSHRLCRSEVPQPERAGPFARGAGVSASES